MPSTSKGSVPRAVRARQPCSRAPTPTPGCRERRRVRGLYSQASKPISWCVSRGCVARQAVEAGVCRVCARASRLARAAPCRFNLLVGSPGPLRRGMRAARCPHLPSSCRATQPPLSWLSGPRAARRRFVAPRAGQRPPRAPFAAAPPFLLTPCGAQGPACLESSLRAPAPRRTHCVPASKHTPQRPTATTPLCEKLCVSLDEPARFAHAPVCVPPPVSPFAAFDLRGAGSGSPAPPPSHARVRGPCSHIEGTAQCAQRC
ncbi:MAG: hypothetical protein J3K34DRAFT_437145 [Monoraphidium minutum]|nr:MAG: hypothetical protein J3K34DRAFT_437145 [Monoraphidium minutum]